MPEETEAILYYVYIKLSAPEPHLEVYLGRVLTGSSFERKFSDAKIASFSEEEKEKFPEPEKLHLFLTDDYGYLTVNTDHVSILDEKQLQTFRDSGETPDQWTPSNLSGAVNPAYAKKVIEGTARGPIDMY